MSHTGTIVHRLNPRWVRAVTTGSTNGMGQERSTTGQEEGTMDQPLRVYRTDDDLASATHVLSVLEESYPGFRSWGA